MGKFGYIVAGLSIGWAIVVSAPLTVEAAAGSTYASREAQATVREALITARDKVGVPEPWQKTIFEEEVLPNAEKFIRSAKQSPNGLLVDVDNERLTNYLTAFHPPAGSDDASKASREVLVSLEADSDCHKCLESLVPARKLVRIRLERRGLVAVWVNPEDVLEDTGGAKLSGSAMEEKLVEMAHAKKNAGAMVVQARPRGTETAGPGARMVAQVMFAFWPTPSAPEARVTDTLEFKENEALGGVFDRVLTDAYADTAVKSARAVTVAGVGTNAAATASSTTATHASSTTAAAPEPMFKVTINGAFNFAQLNTLAAELNTRFHDQGGASLRSVSRGLATYGVKTNASAAEVQRKLAGIQINGAAVATSGVDDHTVQLEVK